MTKKQAEEIGLRVVDWCAAIYGWSKFYHQYTVMVEAQYQSDINKKTYGEFDRDEIMIYIYTRTNKTVACLVNTIIHEYWHYLQCPQWVGRYISKYGEGRKNPYEREAELRADRDTKRCMKDLGL